MQWLIVLVALATAILFAILLAKAPRGRRGLLIFSVLDSRNSVRHRRNVSNKVVSPRTVASKCLLHAPLENRSEYTRSMEYGLGSRIRVRLCSGKIVEAEITAITNQSTGRKLQIVYGSATASINPAQIAEILPTS